MLARMGRIQKRIEATLLPHQWERLQEIRVQARISRYGLSVALADNSLARVLELSDEQKQKLPRVAQERARKLDEEIAELRRKARREILKEVLTKEQIKEFDDLLGEQFEPTRPSHAGSGTRARSGSKGRFKCLAAVRVDCVSRANPGGDHNDESTRIQRPLW